jgi:hypothetical protein
VNHFQASSGTHPAARGTRNTTHQEDGYGEEKEGRREESRGRKEKSGTPHIADERRTSDESGPDAVSVHAGGDRGYSCN